MQGGVAWKGSNPLVSPFFAGNRLHDALTRTGKQQNYAFIVRFHLAPFNHERFFALLDRVFATSL
jgi:hypothetical protein